MNVLRCRLTLLSFLLGGSAFVLGDELTFTVYDIGNLGCPEVTIALDINDFGVLVGVSGVPPCPATDGNGFAWFNGVMTDLTATSEGAPFCSVNGISRDGSVVATGSTWEDLVVFVRDGVSIVIGPPEGCSNNGPAEYINGAGTMIGGWCHRELNGSQAPAIYWTQDGSALVLDLLPDAPADANGWTTDINDSGVVVGYFSYGAEGGRGFIWVDGVMTELVNTMGGGERVLLQAISNSGFISGGADTPDGYQAMRYDMNTGEMIALGEGCAYDVNDRGVAAGSDIVNFGLRAMLYKDGEAIDLHALLPDYMFATHAGSINRYGWIVGEAWDEGYDYFWGWLLVPNYAKGDYDGDGDVDHQDFGHFQRCFAAEPYIDHTLHVGCAVFDFDDDNDLGLDDYARFQEAFTGTLN